MEENDIPAENGSHKKQIAPNDSGIAMDTPEEANNELVEDTQKISVHDSELGEMDSNTDLDTDDKCPWGCHPKPVYNIALYMSLQTIKPVISLEENYQCQKDDNHDSSSVHISDLPSEIFIAILKKLSQRELCRKVAAVCKNWYQHAYDPILWTRLSFRQFPSEKIPAALRLITTAPLLHTIDLHGHSSLSVYALPTIAQNCHFLRSIDLGFCNTVDADILQVLVAGCPHIVDINVEGCDKIDDDCIGVFTQLKGLKSVNVSHCGQVLDASVSRLAEGVAGLQYLNVDGIPWVYKGAMESLATHCSETLTSLDIDGAELEDDSMELICRCCHLQRLSLSFGDLLTDKSLQYLQNLVRLKQLRLRKGGLFTSAGLLHFLSQPIPCSNLEVLDLTECTKFDDDTMLALSLSCRRLRHLSLCWCWNMTDRGLCAIVDNCRNACIPALYTWNSG